MATTAYDPAAQYTYTGGLGKAPQPVPMPNPAADLAQQLPGLPAINNQASNVLLSQLTGQLSPDTLAAIKNATASWGTSNGMPGVSGGTIGGNRGARDVGTTSQALQQQGLANYSNFVPTVSSTQTVAPALQAEVNATNASNAAAPDPGAVASYSDQLFNRYLSQLNGGAAAGIKPLVGPNSSTSPGQNSYVERDTFGNVMNSTHA